jgi:hypothetical protein
MTPREQFETLFSDIEFTDADFYQGRFGTCYKNDFVEFNIETFMSKVVRFKQHPGDCKYEWTGPVHPAGFPLVGVKLYGKRRMINVRRLIAMMNSQTDLSGYQVLCTCHSNNCLTIDHLGIVEDPSAGKPLPWKDKTGRKKRVETTGEFTHIHSGEADGI